MYPKLDGFNTKEITLYTEADIKPGMPVMLAENYSAGIPAAGSRFIGVCTSARGRYVSVALTGVVTVPYSGSGIKIGYSPLTCDGNGKLKHDANGSAEFLVFEVNEYDNLVTFLLR